MSLLHNVPASMNLFHFCAFLQPQKNTLVKFLVSQVHDIDAQPGYLIPPFHKEGFGKLHFMQVSFAHGHPDEV
jgi:hypothetical protein